QKKCQVEGSFRANADKSQSACDAYCISSGYSGGTASATGSKSMCSFGSKYVKDFSTCSMGYDSKIYKSCNSYISCDCSGGQQACSDGTPYGECSSTKPKYCDNGNLVNKPSNCGCPSGYANCDSTDSNGCEVNLNTDEDNCGSCGNSCGTGYNCKNGACVEDSGGTCTEYGGGNGDHYNKGYIILSDGTKLEDHCMTGAYEKHVMEYWCTTDGHGQGNFPCPDGCENGACKSSGGGTCTEYGGGQGDHYNKGYIILSDGTKLEDHCMTGAYEKHVMEYWCTTDGHGQGNFPCPDGCENGACVSGGPDPQTCDAYGGTCRYGGCSSGEEDLIDTFDCNPGYRCCRESTPDPQTCDAYGGTCRYSGCSSGEEDLIDTFDCNPGYRCCRESTPGPQTCDAYGGTCTVPETCGSKCTGNLLPGACPQGTICCDCSGGQKGQDPVADAGFDHRALEEAEVTLDARGSYDPDGTIVSYVWTENGNPICPAGSMCTRDDYSAGTHTITLTVTDNDGNTDSDEMTLTVLGVRPGELRALIDYPKNGQFFDDNQQIYFAGAGVKGGAGKLRLLRWMSSIDDDGYIGSGPYFYKKLSPGKHTITLKAFDNKGNYATDSVTITVDSGEQDTTLPSSWDWSHVVLPHAPPYDPPGANWMTRVKHQGRCGCCAAFGLLGTIEAVYNVEQGNPDLDIDLSEQDLVNCAGTNGCCGVSPIRMLNHIKINGIPDENYFKYTDSTCSHSIVDKKCECLCKYNNPCSNTQCPYSVPLGDPKWVITNYDRMYGSRDEIKKRLTEKGPLFAGMDIINLRQDWDSMDCKGDIKCNHGIVIVGYDDSGGYWIIKNSWGDSNHPYFKVKYGACGIEDFVVNVKGVKKQ
ncbi:MAG: C1 family peptidase, partial [archaeon]|nr:C1 family peptidase [archaeon]